MSYDITTYTGLTEAIQAYTQVNESTFVSNIPNFIKNVERLVNNTVQLPAIRRNVTGTVTSGFPYVDLPDDFLAMFSFAVQTTDVDGTRYSYLLNKDVNYIREMFPYPGVEGVPQYYALFNVNDSALPGVFNATFIMGPTPDQDYTVELHYYAYPTSLVDSSTGTTWLSTNYPNVLLWGSLVEAYLYLKGEQDLVQNYQSKYDQAMQLLKQLGDGKDRQDNYRVTQVRDQVR